MDKEAMYIINLKTSEYTNIKSESTSKRGYVNMEMNDELSLALNVDSKAVGFWRNILYLFKTEADIAMLLHECAGKSRREIDKYVTRVRKDKINNEKYSSVDEFIECYIEDKTGALERLFQEPIDATKLSKLTTNDPRHIFTIHSKLPFAVWFMSFVIYL
ncbi:hypothetical protein [Paenibacillus tianjinensis]|uniref:Uncharacterized protein n=1 Tax=Paenibacillus tianjinensis TaxID=2810347 RepID=A0ABX7L5T8_9BACL|nr:hypothetical protein [Paenibacillus tianjinensis]QSF43467.1 hypothetical protein JRJ22_19580 [Paenibacillus tianjinensis]